MTYRWHNATVLSRQMNCIVTHKFGEENQVADALANHGLTLQSITYRMKDRSPMFVLEIAI
jgi:hypothetical protein